MLVAVLQDKCHPQTIEVCRTRAEGLGLKVLVSNEADFDFNKDVCGVLLQYPATDGSIENYKVRCWHALVDFAPVPEHSSLPSACCCLHLVLWFAAQQTSQGLPFTRQIRESRQAACPCSLCMSALL